MEPLDIVFTILFLIMALKIYVIVPIYIWCITHPNRVKKTRLGNYFRNKKNTSGRSYKTQQK